MPNKSKSNIWAEFMDLIVTFWFWMILVVNKKFDCFCLASSLRKWGFVRVLVPAPPFPPTTAWFRVPNPSKSQVLSKKQRLGDAGCAWLVVRLLKS